MEPCRSRRQAGSRGAPDRRIRDRPASVAEIRLTQHFLELHTAIWQVLRGERREARRKPRFDRLGPNLVLAARIALLLAVFVLWWALVRLAILPEFFFLRHVYLPSATSWAFSSLHNAVGLAVVGSVIGEYLGSARGV
jgi:hypothetical protein